MKPEGPAPEGEWVGRWSGIGSGSKLYFSEIPKDWRTFAALAFRVRATAARDLLGLSVWLPSNTAYGGRNFITEVPLKGKAWEAVRIPLHRFQAVGPCKWSDVEVLCVAVQGDPQGASIEWDDIRLVRGSRGDASCEESPEETVKRVFADRAKAAATIKTAHYLVYSDSKAAGEKFKLALEKIHDLVTKHFGFTPRSEPLLAFVFMKRDDYVAFMVREGMDPPTAKNSAGVGCAAFYATYYQAPEAAVVVHEATHQLVHALGKCGGGGSWFQEGWAVYSENWYPGGPRGGSAAKAFKSNVKIGDIAPLAQFLDIPVLLTPPKADRNYAQAGSLFHYLFEGPRKEKFAALVDALRNVHPRPGEAKAILEKVYDAPLATLETEWKAFCLAQK
ncbi:MAG: DUF1570 domain-containing protein [Planctomycetales bacterium]|nr:DUF1570 domain-containing protein [Planctomycetales bacterium]